MSDFAKMKVAELREALEARGLDTKGLKADLVSRLEEAQAKDTAVQDKKTNESTPPKAVKNRILEQVAADGNDAKSKTPVTTPTRRSRRLSEDFTGQDITSQLKAIEAAGPQTPTRKRLSETSRPTTPTRRRLSQSSAAPPESPSRKSRRLSGGVPEVTEPVKDTPTKLGSRRSRRLSGTEDDVVQSPMPPKKTPAGKAGRRVSAIAAVPEKIEEAIEEAIEEECVALKDVPEEPEDEIVNDTVDETKLNKDCEVPVEGSEKISKKLVTEEETSKGDTKSDGKTSDGDDAAIIKSSTKLKGEEETNLEEVKIDKEAASDDNKIDNPINDVANTNESPSKTVNKDNIVKELKVLEEMDSDVNKCDDGTDTANERNVDKLNDDTKVTADHQINDPTDINKVANTSESPNKTVKRNSGDSKLEEKPVVRDDDKNVVDNIKDSKEGRADDSSIDVITSKELGQKRSIEDTDEPSKKSKRKSLNETPKKDSPFKSVEVTPTETSPDEITTEKSSQKDNNKENIIDQSVSKPINNPQSKSTVLTESVDVAIAEMDVSMSKACDDVITGTNDVIQMMKKELAARKESKKDELLVEAKHIPRQKPKSGKFWKAERSAFRSLKKDKGQRSTFDERLKMKEEKLKNKELAVMLLEKKNLKKAEMRKKIEDNKARKTENEKKSEQFQIIKNPAKIKRMKKKQLRQLEKRDLLAVKT